MSVVRFVVSLILAVVLVVGAGLLLAVGYGAAVAGSWDGLGLDEGEDGGAWLWLDEEPFYYRFWGPDEGRTYVLVHGLQVEGSATWTETARGISRSGVRVLTVDLRGFGRSSRAGEAEQFTLAAQAELLARMVNELGVRDAVVVGHGWGGAVALRMAAEQPQLVERVAVLYPEGLVDERSVPARLVRLPLVGSALTWGCYVGGPLWARDQRAGFLDPTQMSPDHVDDLRPLSQAVGTLEAWIKIAALPSEELYSEVIWPDLPVLVVRPTSDVDEELAALPWLANVPEESVATVQAGRWLQMERSDSVNALLLAFVP
jgi:pimeloyl-ACP methyl ester carboxylesterase